MSRTLCASHIATGIARARSGRAAVLCDELVPDDVDTCPACGCESPTTRARLAIVRIVDFFDAHEGRGRGDIEKTVRRMSWSRARLVRP